MTRKYREYTPNEMGLNKRSNWTWFHLDIDRESLWFTNGHIAMDKSPVDEFPVEVPAGAKNMPTRRRDAIRNPENGITPFPGQNLIKCFEFGKELREVSRTERGSFPGEIILSDWDGNGVRSSWNETIEVRVARHYYSFLKRKYPDALFHAPKYRDRPVILVKDDSVVAILIQIIR